MSEPRHRWAGIFAATPCPLAADYSVDVEALRGMFDWLCDGRGLAGFLVNGHAGENPVMTLDAQVAVARSAVDTVQGRALIVAGINRENALEAAAYAPQLQAAGVDAVMVFPPNGWALFQDDGAALDLHRRVIDSCDLPVLLFQASVGAGSMRYRADVLAALVRLPRVVAIKEGSWEVAAYEETRRLVNAAAPGVAVLGSGDEHLFTSYAVGSEGALVSLAAVTPEPIVALHDAMRRKDLDAAREAHERIYPIARAIYRDAPGGRANARLKSCLKLLGLFPDDRMLPPGIATPTSERQGLEQALRAAGAWGARPARAPDPE